MALTEKSIETVKRWIAELGTRQTAVKLIDRALNNIVGLSSSDLSDSAIFANGLDEIEPMLEDGDFQGAYDYSKEVADEMLEDEGMGMGMGDMDERKQTRKVPMNELRSLIQKIIRESAEHERYSKYFQDINARLKSYAEANGENWLDLKRYFMEEADPYNMKTPKEQIDIYFKLVDDFLKDKGASSIKENIETKKFSIVEKTKRGMTWVVAYPDQYGIETEEGLYGWESDDSPNRELYFAKNIAEAEDMLKNFR